MFWLPAIVFFTPEILVLDLNKRKIVVSVPHLFRQLCFCPATGCCYQALPEMAAEKLLLENLYPHLGLHTSIWQLNGHFHGCFNTLLFYKTRYHSTFMREARSGSLIILLDAYIKSCKLQEIYIIFNHVAVILVFCWQKRLLVSIWECNFQLIY